MLAIPIASNRSIKRSINNNNSSNRKRNPPKFYGRGVLRQLSKVSKVSSSSAESKSKSESKSALISVSLSASVSQWIICGYCMLLFLSSSCSCRCPIIASALLNSATLSLRYQSFGRRATFANHHLTLSNRLFNINNNNININNNMTVSQETNSNDNDNGNGNISVTSSNGSINTNANINTNINCNTSSNTSKPIVKAKLISASNESLISAGQRLRSGHLVSFPTETVYGLGCHALDPDAIRRVFQAKERPFADPLIVHVNNV